jgi:D-glycero-D-manno-heptose 1,7-bisphosphate phosphatase
MDKPTTLSPALFLDRDGVIIQNRPDYVLRWSQVHVFPWALDALASLAGTSWRIIIVTNQSAIGRGIVPAERVDDINRRLVEKIEKAGGHIDGIYVCPHAPGAGCNCRKPRPGLLIRAAEDLSLDLGNSILVGDALEDIEAGRKAGVPLCALVRTGRGMEQLQRPETARMEPFLVADRFDRELVEILRMKNLAKVME